MKFEKEFYLHLEKSAENKRKREAVLKNAKETFSNLKTPEERADNFIEENSQFIEDLFNKERREEFNNLIKEAIEYRVPTTQRINPEIFRVKIEIEPVFIYIPKENQK